MKFTASAAALGVLGTGTSSAQGELNVKDFGAKGDGKTVDTEVFQEAMDAAAGGGTVYVPPGEYLVAQVLVPEKTTVYGEGHASTVLHAPWDLDALPKTEIFLMKRVDDVTIRELSFSGNLNAMEYSTRPGTSNSDLLDFSGGQRVALERCYIDEPFSGDAVDLDRPEDSFNYSIVDNHIDCHYIRVASRGTC